VSYIALAALAYLVGSIPTGFLVAKARGVDIRKVGSGNIGATNVLRTLGRTAGSLVLLADGMKGWAAVALLPDVVFAIFGIPHNTARREYYEILAGFSVVLGHNYTCWLHFKGGKGIATSAGVLAALVPLALVIVVCLWIVVFALTRYVSVVSMSASFALPFATWLTHQSSSRVIVTACMGALAIYKHRPNIERLMKGTESRFVLAKNRVKEPAERPS